MKGFSYKNRKNRWFLVKVARMYVGIKKHIYKVPFWHFFGLGVVPKMAIRFYGILPKWQIKC